MSRSYEHIRRDNARAFSSPGAAAWPAGRAATEHLRALIGEGGRDSEREGGSQGGQFHRTWLARDYGDKAATASAIRSRTG
jgi:hypothetical protein